MKSAHLLFLGILFCGILSNLNAQESDTLKNYWLNRIDIVAKKSNIGDESKTISKDNLDNVLRRNGFSLIRKGVFFAQDIYADGLKRGDISVLIDGERYHSACPNRMDSPLTRVNPLELESVDLSKNSGHLQSGLGGSVQFNRSLPKEDLAISTEITALACAQSGIDLAILGDFAKNRLTLRFSEGATYKDGDGNSFSDNYNYNDNYDFKLAEGSFRGKSGEISYGTAFSYTENISFPYLLMDERYNRVFNGHLSYKSHKVYFNYTDHMMDNDMRNGMTLMRTSVTNLTLGAVGDFYEFIFRNWNANNFFKNPNLFISNDLIPDVSTYMLNLFKSYKLYGLEIHSKLGLEYKSVAESNRREFYKNLYEEAELSRIFPIFSLGATYLKPLSKFVVGGILMELNSESPSTESLFIAVKKPGTKPTWSGNPTLLQPVKFGMRGILSFHDFSLELYGSHVWNYNNLSKSVINEKKYLTFSNIDARIYGTNLSYSNPNLDFNLSYTWAKNISNSTPLAEIPPLSIDVKIISPKFYDFNVYTKLFYNDSQFRVDENLNEKPSFSWARVDIGANYSWYKFSLSFDIENLLNNNYFQHLSFLRDPFMSNSQVYEPGRTFRITLKTNSLF